jgi:hypothetical protein
MGRRAWWVLASAVGAAVAAPGVAATAPLDRVHPDPGYATDVDPHPDEPFALHVGAVHEHSGYSDGDPGTVPRDYFDAARTGVNGTGRGVILDFLFSSEHSDNDELPITTNQGCLPPGNPLACSHVTDAEHLRKWATTLEQAYAASTDSFTGMRGFEWTNDVYNHMNVYFSTNVVNVKTDGSYFSMDVMWDWLREPVASGGGADGLVTFNHPGREPSLTPFDSGGPHSELLTSLAGGANWNDLRYVPDVDGNVVGMEVNGGDDIEYYVLALTNGWHIGAVAAEDEHGRNWASSDQSKTLVLTRGRAPQDYYWALRNHRTIAVQDALVGGAPGTRAQVPSILFWADGASVDDPGSTVLGGIAGGGGSHSLHVSLAGLPAGASAALVSDAAGALGSPVPLGVADAGGALDATHTVTAPADGEDWWFVVVCLPGAAGPCGTTRDYAAVTAPIWIAAG